MTSPPTSYTTSRDTTEQLGEVRKGAHRLPAADHHEMLLEAVTR